MVNIIRQITHKQVRHCLQNDSITVGACLRWRTDTPVLADFSAADSEFDADAG
jgi:hypothetical protein